MTDPLRFGTRRSPLARWQTQHVRSRLEAALEGLLTDERTYSTEGDRRLDVPLPEVGGKGLFTLELERALLAGEIDAAVHSLKDLPTGDPEGLTLGAVTSRADVRDALVSPRYGTLEALPHGALVGTSSPRRAAQILRIRPDLRLESIRGNVGTRLRKVDEGGYDAALFACAGLERLGLMARAIDILSLDAMLPAPGQAALAVQARSGDTRVLAALAAIDEAPVRAATTAERAFLAALGGGCSAPIAAYASGYPVLTLRARVLSVDGCGMVEVEGVGTDPLELAGRLADDALAAGAGRFLALARA